MFEMVGFEPPNLLFLKLQGIVDETSMEQLFEKFAETTKKVGFIHVLMDISELENITPKAREKARTIRASFSEGHKVASFGGRPVVRALGTLICKIMPQASMLKFFKTEEEARAWLKEEK